MKVRRIYFLVIILAIFVFSTEYYLLFAQQHKRDRNFKTELKVSDKDIKNTNGIKWGKDILMSSEAHKVAITSPINDCISVSGKSVHTVWISAMKKDQGKVYYRKSNDLGKTWDSPILLEDSNYRLGGITVNSCASNVYIVWKQVYSGSNGELFCKVSHNNGKTWSKKVKISREGIERSSAPNILCDGNSVYVVWENYRKYNGKELANTDIRISHDRGNTWSEAIKVTDANEGGPYLTLADNGDINMLHISHNYDLKRTKGYNWEIMFTKSKDKGKTWQEPVRLTEDIGDSRFPTAVTTGSKIYTVWWDDRDDTRYEKKGYPAITPKKDHNFEIYFKKSLDNGKTWSEDIRLTNARGVSADPSIKANGNNIYVIWGDGRSKSEDIYFKYSTDGGKTWSKDLKLTNKAPTMHPSLDIDHEGNVYVLWSERKGEEMDIYFKKGKINTSILREQKQGS